MSSDVATVTLKINRFDLDDEPVVEEKTIELPKDSDYNGIKLVIQQACNINDMEGKVIKIRNKDGALVPPTFMLDDNNSTNPFTAEISKIAYNSVTRATPTLIQDVYANAISKTLSGMENRVLQAEKLIPQLQWRRQTHTEQTVNSLSTRVAFLDRRIDELTPPQWKTKIPQRAA